ncbi:DUF3850 domain-containing protein [Enterococcus casseliflavus]|uniref:DUF3850 domain-containing protein n=1 Tax=Enterococcus casseliflavus TaxID=37734 RepID=UPI0034D17142
MTHNLKIDKQFFSAILNNLKTFEIRYNDRNFQVGDFITLEEVTEDSEYTGRKVSGVITYMTDYQQQEGYIVFSFIKI